MKLGIVIQARLGATRLPNKTILPFWKNYGILELLIKKLELISSEIPIIIATTNNNVDDKIELLFKDNKRISLFRGNEKNVLDRFIKTAHQFSLSKIIRICADNPFLEIHSLKILIDDFLRSNLDYLYYNINGNPNMKTHYGFWAEGVALSALEKIDKKTNKQLYLEHVTNYIYTNPDEFIIDSYEINFEDFKDKIRLTLDTSDDFRIQKKIFEQLISKYPEQNFHIKDIIEIINSDPLIIIEMQKIIATQIK